MPEAEAEVPLGPGQAAMGLLHPMEAAEEKVHQKGLVQPGCSQIPQVKPVELGGLTDGPRPMGPGISSFCVGSTGSVGDRTGHTATSGCDVAGTVAGSVCV